MKKFAGDTIILHMCTKNHNHMIYSSPNDPKNQNLKKMKKAPGGVIILHVYQK